MQKATEIKLFSFSTPAMRAFHMTWLAFFVCFFAWFACAPLMPVIKGEFGLTKDQIANINIAAVAITILVRLAVGPLCDKYGPRITYTTLLLLGSIPMYLPLPTAMNLFFSSVYSSVQLAQALSLRNIIPVSCLHQMS